IKHAKAIEQMNSIAANDLLRQRSPEDFAKVLGNMAGAERDFYIDGGLFLQTLESGGESATQALANAPTVLEQLDDALPTNGLIRIPAKEFMQSISGSGLDEALIPYLRVDPEAPNQMEAEQCLQVQAEETKAAVEQAMEKMVVDQAFADSAHVVEATIVEQLNTPEVFARLVSIAAKDGADPNALARTYALLTRDFVVTQAAREGISPEEWYAQHPLSILDNVPRSGDATLGQYGGAQAVQVDIAKNKDVADKMLAAGADPEQVRVATGWFNGQYDSKPRFEFSDQEAAFTDAFANLPESQLFGEKQTMKLGDVLQHDELFKYYPEARDIDIVKRKGFMDMGGLQGWFDSKNEIGVTPYAQDPLSTVLHEVQHWIQIKEGFATGGNENAVFEALTPEQKRRIAERALNEAEANVKLAADQLAAFQKLLNSPLLDSMLKARMLLDEARALYPDPGAPERQTASRWHTQTIKELRQDAFGAEGYFELTQEEQRASMKVELGPREAETVDQMKARLLAGAEGGVVEAIQAYSSVQSGDPEAVKSALKKSGDMYKLYNAIAGEVEARDVQARQQMSAAERAATPPLSSETFDPKDVIVAFDKAEQASILAQDTTTSARGAFNPKTLTLSLLETANYSTFVHELGHYQLTVLADIASRPNAPAQVVEDMNKLLEWFKVPTLEAWNAMTLEQQRPHHEQMAEGMETYMFEGRAPSIDLEPVFARIKQWMMRVYKSLVEMRVPLTDEVRGVFDRLYAVDQDIKAAEEARSMLPLFETREEFPLGDEEWQNYRDTSIGAHEAGAAQLQARSLRDMQFTARFRLREIKKLQKDAAEKRKAMMVEAEQAVGREPVYAVQDFLRGKPLEEGVLGALSRDQRRALTESGLEGTKLDLDLLKAVYGEDPAAPWRYLPTGKNGLVAANGTDPELVASLFGYKSGDEMIKDILQAEPREARVEGRTDQMMLERYGDLTDARAIEQAVDEAIHNKVRTRMVATELSALETAVLGEKGKGRRPQMLKALRNLVKATMGGKRIGDIKVGQHVASETRAAKESSAALKKGDQKAAVNFKRQHMWHNLSAIEARKVEKEIDRALKYLKRFDKRPDSVAPDYLDRIEDILERFDLRRRSEAQVKRTESLAKWLDQVEADKGVRPVVPASLEDEARRTPYRRMTLNDFRELVDAVKSIEHIGKTKQKLMTAAKEREVNNAAAAFAASATAHAPRVVPDRVESVGPVALARHAGAVVVAGHEKLSSWTRELDGYLDNGEATRLFSNTATAAGANEAVRTMRSTDAINKFFGPLIKRIGFMPFNTAKVVDGAVGRDGGPLSLSYQGRLMVVANMGNEVNYQRMRDGEGWTDATMAAVLNSLTKEDMQFVQAMWDHLDGYKTEIGALEKELTGVEPEWVEAKPLQTPHGTFAGGYFPIMYDSRRDTRAKAFETLIDASAM
ncbi:MAG: LPD23 domain-containing protein, partial [Devosia sp.]